jgi:hypothetical protein
MATSPATVGDRKYVEGSTWVDGEDRLHTTYFTYRHDAGLVGGARMTVHFTVDGTRQEVWPVVKDFNAWQNSEGYYYSGVVGDLEGKGFRLGTDPNELEGPDTYEVLKVLPEYIIVLSQPTPEGAYGVGDLKIGQGGVSAGAHIVGLDEFEPGRTTVTFHMEHASVMAPGDGADSVSEEEAIDGWRPMTEEAARKWREGFISNVKQLVEDARGNA